MQITFDAISQQNLIHSVATYGSILFIIFYLFAIVGMNLFAGKITDQYVYDDGSPEAESFCGNIKLKGSAFFDHKYCLNNFNDLTSSLIVLFELLVVNQWHVITEGYVLVTSSWARLFFISFHIACVILILNIFTAFVLEAFILEYSMAKSGSASPLARKISQMGLAYGSTAPNPGKGNPEGDNDASCLRENELDADHETCGLEDHEDDNVASKANSGGPYPNLSSQTFIRFKLNSKPKSVQHLLEKMFERDLM